MRTKYQMMKPSESVTDDNGVPFPDLATFPIEQFTVYTKPIEYKLNQKDTERFFDLMYDFYNSFDFYDDITLWLNDITYISDDEENFEKKIKIYSKTDLDSWYLSSVKGETIENNRKINL